ncbi:trypsin-like peptidase domain-containing protein, partial [Actinoplanes sp. NPDC051633]|uniref:trypsin-like peptidase domain-containing protein n=1 Tax=Actinoplanes sp. NPDC051633 TaxID=3155670 RepID=UPI00342C9536
MAGVHGPAPWMVRILDAGGTVHGAGMLVAPDRVLTCAHVVPAAAFVQFVDPPDGPRLPATVAFLEPSGASWRGDIALLALDRPHPDRVTATLRRFPVRRARRLRAYAFPQHPEIGYWAVTELVGQGGPGGEWMQLANVSGFPVSKGFSGAGVLAEPLDHLVGMIVAAQPADGQSFMIPADTIATYLPGVPWIVGEPAVSGFSDDQRSGTPDASVLREMSEFIDGPPGANVRVVVSGPSGSAGSVAVREAVLTSDPVDLAVNCAGLSVRAIIRRIAERAGVDDRHIADNQAPPMVIVLSRVDQALDPAGVLRSVVHPLSERDANRILLTFDEEHSAALPLARSIEKERSTRQSDPGEVRSAVSRARLAERSAEKLHRRAGAVISGLPPLERRSPRLRAEFAALTGSGPEAAALRAAALEATDAALAVADRLGELLREHADQRGLLTSYQQLSARYGHAEDPGLTALYQRAYALLH